MVDASLLTNGSAAFERKLPCHWLKSLHQHHVMTIRIRPSRASLTVEGFDVIFHHEVVSGCLQGSESSIEGTAVAGSVGTSCGEVRYHETLIISTQESLWASSGSPACNGRWRRWTAEPPWINIYIHIDLFYLITYSCPDNNSSVV